MKEISNRALAILAVIAIVISIASLFSYRTGDITHITGRAASSIGTVSAEIAEVSVTVKDNIDFGSGRVYPESVNATLDSYAGTVEGGTWSPVQEYIRVENNGKSSISVSVNAGKNSNSAALIGGTSPRFQVKVVAEKSGSCRGLQADYKDVPESEDAPLILCGIVPPGSGFNVAVKLVIPSDASTGQRNTMLIFSAQRA